jgi:xylulokinase
MSLMGIDIGTTGTKAIVFNEDGKILGKAYAEYNLVFPRPNWVEMDNNELWTKVFGVISDVNSLPEVMNNPVTALSVTTYGESFTPLDKKGNILYNSIYSTDSRSMDELGYILTKYDEKKLFEITGYPAKYICPLNKILWLKKNREDIYRNTEKILFTEDLFYYLLGIEKTKINHSLCSRTLFFDIKQKKWAMDLLDAFDIDVDLFSEPSRSGIIIGNVAHENAEKLGFKGNVSIVIGSHDQPCAALGVGAINGGIAADGMGTVECVSLCLDEINTSEGMFKNNFCCQAHAVDGKYVTLLINMSSGSAVKWFKNNFLSGSSEQLRTIFADFNFEPTDLLFLPYFSASGTPYMDPLAKATITGMNLSTKRDNILKALIEGLVMEICFNLELASDSGVAIGELRAVGGGAKSDFELKLKASIINKPIKRMNVAEAGCLSTMMLAGMGTGIFTLEEAINKFVEIDMEFEPDDKIANRYAEKFVNYKKMYRHVSQLNG